MEVDVVGHRPTVGDGDQRGDEAAAPAARDEVAVPHAGPADPDLAVVVTDHQCRVVLGQQERHGGVVALDAAASGQLDRWARFVGEEPDGDRRWSVGRLEPQPHAVARHDCGVRGICGEDDVDAEAEFARQSGEVVVEAICRHDDVGRRRRRRATQPPQ